jgi:DNA-directed RNA polymerase subunit beta'
VSAGVNKRDAKGYLLAITGTRPGNGFFQAKIMKRLQTPSGRAVVSPGPELSMDEVGLPEEMAWTLYSKFLIGRLVRRGYPATEAQRMVEDRVPVARDELINEAKERPVLVNRAPSLHRANIVAAYPRLISGKAIKISPAYERGATLDYDGDAVQIHVPVTQGAIEDAKNMTLSRLLFSDRNPRTLNIAPEMESIMGLHRATQPSSDKKTRSFASTEDALAAYHRGEVALNDSVKIDK